MTDKVGATFLHRGWLFCVIEDNQAAICLMCLWAQQEELHWCAKWFQLIT